MSGIFYRGARIRHRLEDIRDPHFVVSVDRGDTRFFLNFASVDHFEYWYAMLDPTERTINEVIMSDRRKLIIDIDESNDESLMIFDFERHIKNRIHEVFMMLEIGVPEVTVYHMTDEYGEACYEKLSYHVVVSNFSFSASTCKGLCMIISSGQVWDKCADTSVYKKVQCIRMEESTKFREKRWKRTCGYTAGFRSGLVSRIEDTVESDFTCNLCYDYVALSYFSPGDVDMSQFKIGKRCPTYVSLTRIKPGYCSQCCRVHHRENAVIRYGKCGPIFLCWRFESPSCI